MGGRRVGFSTGGGERPPDDDEEVASVDSKIVTLENYCCGGRFAIGLRCFWRNIRRASTFYTVLLLGTPRDDKPVSSGDLYCKTTTENPPPPLGYNRIVTVACTVNRFPKKRARQKSLDDKTKKNNK